MLTISPVKHSAKITVKGKQGGARPNNSLIFHANSPLSSTVTTLISTSKADGSSLMDKQLSALRDLQYQAIYKACSIKSDIQFLSTLSLVHREVTDEKLALHADAHVHQDVGLQRALQDLLVCYDPAWLLLAYNILAIKEVSSHLPRPPVGLARLVLNNLLLRSDEVESRFPANKLLYLSQEQEKRALLRQVFVEKFLEMVLFLDRARLLVVLDTPTLFTASSEYKSSKEIIEAFCRLCMRGEGDITKHLAALHYTVHFAQKPFDEYVFTVSDVKQDLKDGVRLVKLYAILAKQPKLLEQIRLPTVSRLQKLHNIELVLSALGQTHSKSVTSKQIADGHVPSTITLCWAIMQACDLHRLASVARILEEISIIRRDKKWRQSVHNPQEAAKLAVKVKTTESTDDACDGEDSSMTCMDMSVEKALVAWVGTIGQMYSLDITDMSSSFADGRALCLLFHYYHPSLIPTRQIRKTCRHLSSDSTLTKDKAVMNEHKNFAMLRKACKEIGGVALPLPEPLDTFHPPESKFTVMFLAYCFMRLTDTAKEVRAAIRLQRFARKHSLLDENVLNLTDSQPTQAILDTQAALLLLTAQQQEELDIDRKQQAVIRGITRLQAVYRTNKVRKDYYCFMLALEILQTSWKKKRFLRNINSVMHVKIAKMLEDRQHRQFIKHKSVTRLQCFARQVQARAELSRLRDLNVWKLQQELVARQNAAAITM
ncbi:hypothetical protein EON64_15105, partial [archaeon]